MAVVKLQSYLPRWVGLSTDTKPGIGVQPDGSTIVSADLPTGSTFLELDSGRFYRFDGYGDWVAGEPEDKTGELLEAVLIKLHAIHETLVEGLA